MSNPQLARQLVVGGYLGELHDALAAETVAKWSQALSPEEREECWQELKALERVTAGLLEHLEADTDTQAEGRRKLWSRLSGVGALRVLQIARGRA